MGILLMELSWDSTPHPMIPQSLHFVTYSLLKQVFDESPIKQVPDNSVSVLFFSTPTNVSCSALTSFQPQMESLFQPLKIN
jgi:hypothetical protein